MRNLYIDGYNVINSWSILKKIARFNLESSREKFISIMQNYAAYSRDKIYIVFDGHMVPKNAGTVQKRDAVTVIFTKEGETADSFIEKSVNEVGRKIEVCVITSDNLEQQLIFQRGATRMSSLEFYYAIKKAEKDISSIKEKKCKNEKVTIGDIIDPKVLEKLEKIRNKH